MTNPSDNLRALEGPTQQDKDAAADLIETYWHGGDAAMMKLAKSYRDGLAHGAFVRAFQRHRLDALEAAEARIVALSEELEEAVNWSALVDRHGTDRFEDLAEAWLSMEPIKRMTNAICSPFAKYSDEAIMSRFKTIIADMMIAAFTEGCFVGVRAESARALLSTPTQLEGNS